jgi:hypothetical protein
LRNQAPEPPEQESLYDPPLSSDSSLTPQVDRRVGEPPISDPKRIDASAGRKKTSDDKIIDIVAGGDEGIGWANRPKRFILPQKSGENNNSGS